MLTFELKVQSLGNGYIKAEGIIDDTGSPKQEDFDNLVALCSIMKFCYENRLNCDERLWFK